MRLLVLLLCGSVSTLGVGLGLMYRAANVLTQQAVEIQPSLAVPVETVYEPQTVKFLFQIVNNSNKAVTVREVQSSCGCMQAVSYNNEPILEPIRIPAGGTHPIQVSVSTRQLSGPQEYSVKCISDIDGRELLSEAKIRLNVVAGIRSDPAKLYFAGVETGKEHSQDIAILDSYPAPGVEIADVESSDYDTVWTQLTKLRQPRLDEKTNLKKRYILRVFCLPEKAGEIVEHSLRVVPKDSGQPDLQIPIIVSSQPSRFNLTPSKLLAVGGKPFSRRVTVETEGDFAVLRSADYLKVAVDSLDRHTKVIRVEGDPSGLSLPVHAEIVFGDRDTNTEHFVLPLDIVAEPQ